MMRRLPIASVVIGALVLVFAVLMMMRPGERADPQGRIRVISRLDEFTRKSNPGLANTIPSFLAQRGRVGVVPAQADEASPLTTRDVTPIDIDELQKGFCTATLTRLVRQQYPGDYDDMPDAQLEKTVLQKRPEYRDRVCVLPVWISADPHEIVKYEVEP